LDIELGFHGPHHELVADLFDSTSERARGRAGTPSCAPAVRQAREERQSDSSERAPHE
jgi:hypothetical protein